MKPITESHKLPYSIQCFAILLGFHYFFLIGQRSRNKVLSTANETDGYLTEVLFMLAFSREVASISKIFTLPNLLPDKRAIKRYVTYKKMKSITGHC